MNTLDDDFYYLLSISKDLDDRSEPLLCPICDTGFEIFEFDYLEINICHYGHDDEMSFIDAIMAEHETQILSKQFNKEKKENETVILAGNNFLIEPKVCPICYSLFETYELESEKIIFYRTLTISRSGCSRK